MQVVQGNPAGNGNIMSQSGFEFAGAYPSSDDGESDKNMHAAPLLAALHMLFSAALTFCEDSLQVLRSRDILWLQGHFHSKLAGSKPR